MCVILVSLFHFIKSCNFLKVGWAAEGTDTGTRFEDVDLKEKEWVDYDNKAKVSVGIYEFEYQFHKEK